MEMICPGDPESHPTVEPGGDGFGAPLKASSARQLFLLKPADDDFSGGRTQGPLPSPAETECGRVRERAEGERGEGRSGREWGRPL